MYCQKCGVLNSEDAKFCKNCGNSLQQPTQTFTQQQEFIDKKEESVGAAYIILALLIPLIGFILYFSWKKEQPKKANSLLPWAFVGIVINIILMAAA